MEAFWIQVIHLYFPVTVAIVAQLVFIFLPVNLRTWRTDVLNAWTYCCIQTFVAGILFLVVPKVFGIFKLSDSAAFVAILAAFVVSWWKVIRTIPLEATFTVNSEFEEQPAVTFDYFYSADRLRQLGEFAADDSTAVARHRALREMLVRRRVDRNIGDSDEN
ncbi:MAG: hypothetical protein RI932_363 [Pseudomonadota bacterium]|jgi:hypothetical protein